MKRLIFLLGIILCSNAYSQFGFNILKENGDKAVISITDITKMEFTKNDSNNTLNVYSNKGGRNDFKLIKIQSIVIRSANDGFTVTDNIQSMFFYFSAIDSITFNAPLEEKTAYSGTGTIGPNGGSVSLTDGATISIDAGVLSVETQVMIKRILNEEIFGNVENRYCYEVIGVPANSKVNLTLPCGVKKPLETVAVFNYEAVNYTGSNVAFEYDSVNGKVMVKNYTLLKDLKGLANAERWIVEWDDKKEFGAEELNVPMPFYEQIGGSCWATDATMLTKAFTPYKDRESETEISDYLKGLNLGMDDGIGIYSFMHVLGKKFNAYTGGAGYKTESYFNKTKMLKQIIKTLKENKPLILYMPNHAHAVLVVGYRTFLNSSGYDDWELLIHDSKGVNPPSADEGTMYTVRKWSWFMQGSDWRSLFLILYPGAAVHPARALQTVNFPSYPSGVSYVTFDYYKKVGGSKGTISLQWDKKHEGGYRWCQNGSVVFDTLPKTVKAMNVKLQLYNADLSASQNVKLTVKIVNAKKSKTTFMQDYYITLANDKNPYLFDLPLDTSLWLKNYGDTTITEYYLSTRLIGQNGDYQDGWLIKFKIKGGKWIKSYINSFVFNTADLKFAMWGETFATKITCSLSGDKFRVTRDRTDTDQKYATVYIPPMDANTNSRNYTLKLKLSGLDLFPARDGYTVFIDKGKLSWSGSYSNDLDNTGDWSIPITIEKGQTYKTYVVSVYPKIQDPQGIVWGTVYAFNLFTIDIISDY